MNGRAFIGNRRHNPPTDPSRRRLIIASGWDSAEALEVAVPLTV
jgi:hypothetical protein